MKIRKYLRKSALLLALICCLSFLEQASAQLIPVNDNSSAPYFGLYGGGLNYTGTINNDDSAVWLNRNNVWVLGFQTTASGTSWTWTDIEGNSGDMYAAKKWIAMHPGSKFVYSVAMLPGTAPGGVGTPESGHTLAKGANGDYDAHFTALAQKIVAAGIANDTILRPGWEFNGTWYPWCIKYGTSGREAADFKAYFARITTVIRAVPGCENMKFVFCGTTISNSYYPGEAYPKDIPESTVFPVHPAYPGNTYVDYVGTDLYDTSVYYPGSTQTIRDKAWGEQVGSGGNHLGTWQNIATSATYGNGKPFCIPEWGCSQNTSNGGLDNPDFIQHMFNYIQNPAYNVAFHMYFNTYNNWLGYFPTAKAKYKQLFGLPLPNKNDIGTVGISGAADGISVSGAGAGYLTTGTTDNFFFSSRPAAADDMFIVKLTSMDPGTAAQSGVMLRQGTAAGDKYAAVFLRNGQCLFQSRTAAGAALQNSIPLAVTAPTTAAPVWLKLLRKGSSVSGYVSTDSANWSYVGGQSVTLTGTPIMGLAVSSGNTTALNVTDVDERENPDFAIGLEESIANTIIVDNASTVSGAIVKTGTWTLSSSIAGYYGGNYDIGPASGTASVKFTPTLPAAGLYAVYMRWPQDNDFTYDAPISITSTEGTVSLTANQAVAPDLWHYAGTYNFAQGTAGSVTINRSETGYTTVADSVMFVPHPENLIVDNTLATLTGSWTTSTGATGQFYGANYRHDGNAGKGTKTARFTPSIPKTGTYQVYANWTVVAGLVYPTNVPYTITHAGGTTNLAVNQSDNGGEWNLVGTYTFNEGTSGNVLISTTGTTGYVIADAIRFVYVPPTETIVDNSSAALTGTWTTSTGAVGQFYGADYIHDGNSTTETKTATLSFDVPTSGTYQLYSRWTTVVGTPYPTNVPYTVTHAGGTSNLSVNQSVNGGIWNLIGTYTFNAGTPGIVKVSNAGASGYVIVDAMKLVKQ